MARSQTKQTTGLPPGLSRQTPRPQLSPNGMVPSQIQRLITSKQGIWLDVGCGGNKSEGAVGMDKRDLPGVDVVHDIRNLPWPLPDACCHRVLMSHLVEHLPGWDILDILDEVWRVTKVHGQLMIATPYAGSPRFWQDPTHVHGWNEATATYWDPSYPLYEVYRPKPWKIELNEWHSIGDLTIILAKLAETEETADNSEGGLA